MDKMENFYAVCKGLMFKGWLSVENMKHVANGDLINLNITPEQSKDFRHFLTQSLMEIAYSDSRLILKYLHSGLEQGKGEGTRCMMLLTKLCDEYELPIELDAYSGDKNADSARRLFAFYQKFGFNFNANHVDWKDVSCESDLTSEDFSYGVAMIRMPKSHTSQ
ncbi:hypothetical protein VSVS12_04106 [Vibrio scophthalmi]|uniref:hypothetical protein n=1 Tax=Vibrio scophthalmi TaxID=45658 RepID=UPI00080960C6|nr:hypothetical protein [Vibrio scophthalmi]ANS87806.1 hypothetical protein VSVS12_04106 [Vibrio scophthalmi]